MTNFHAADGAVLAVDGIPLHFGDLKAEYEAALNQAVLMDRSHEGRFESVGRDRFALIQRISTHDVEHMPSGEGRPTILTNPTGRIIDRLMVYNRGEKALITTEPGRSDAVRNYLKKQVFFNDDFQLRDLSAETSLFTLHGPNADAFVETLVNIKLDKSHSTFRCLEISIAGQQVVAAERKAVSGAQWALIVPSAGAGEVWQALLESGKAHGLVPAGSLTYNTLRIQAGRPGAGRELSQDYIPLEAGLWDEVSFSKGCYTGQEIIARMESRGKLAKAMVRLSLTQMVDAPAPLLYEGKAVGTLTSSVQTPKGEYLGIGFVKLALAEPEQSLAVGEAGAAARVLAIAGVQPQFSE